MVFPKVVDFGTFVNCECSRIPSLPSEDIRAKVNAEHFTHFWSRGWSQITVPHGKKPTAQLKVILFIMHVVAVVISLPGMWRKDTLV